MGMTRSRQYVFTRYTLKVGRSAINCFGPTGRLVTYCSDLDVVIAPCGGGGLLAGTAIAAKALQPRLRVFGAEPAAADDATRSYRSGKVEPLPPATTIADGLRTTLAPRTLSALRACVDAMGTCSEDAIVAAMRMTWERMKIIIEPSSAVPLACLIEGSLDARGKRVGIIVSGATSTSIVCPGGVDRLRRTPPAVRRRRAAIGSALGGREFASRRR